MREWIVPIVLVVSTAIGCAANSHTPMDTRRLGPPAEDPAGDMAWTDDAGVGPDGAAAVPPVPPSPPPSGPLPLRCGRTYDHELDYFERSGDVSVVYMFHRDQTTLPADEGSVPCSGGCEEHVSRLANGATLSGVFTGIETFNVQSAASSEPGVGRLVVEACGVAIDEYERRVERTGAPGFVNLPSPAWPVPTRGDCTFTLRATGGYVDVRAVTTTCPAAPADPTDPGLT